MAHSAIAVELLETETCLLASCIRYGVFFCRKKVNFFGLKLKLKFRALDNSFLSLNLCRAALRAVSAREREEGEGPSLLLTITFMHARSEVVVASSR